MTAGVNTANHNQLEPNVEGRTQPHARHRRAPVGETLQGYAGLDDPNRLFILPTSELGHTTPTSLFTPTQFTPALWGRAHNTVGVLPIGFHSLWDDEQGRSHN